LPSQQAEEMTLSPRLLRPKKEWEEQRTRNKEQGTKNKEQRTRNKEQGTKNKEQGTKNKEQRTRNKEQIETCLSVVKN
jgi:hypothetical protein